PDRRAEEGRHGEHRDPRAIGRYRKRDGVGDDHVGDRGLHDSFERGSREDAVGGERIDLFRPVCDQRGHRLDERAGGVDLVVDDHRVLALDLADDVHQLGLVLVAHAPLLDDGQRGPQDLGEVAGLLGESELAAHDLSAPVAPASATASMIEPAVSISSSMLTAFLPSTSPMMFISSVLSSLPTRRFSTMASGAPRISAKLRAFLANPSSLTTTMSSRSLARM